MKRSVVVLTFSAIAIALFLAATLGITHFIGLGSVASTAQVSNRELILSNFQSDHGFVLQSGTGIQLEDTTSFAIGNQSLKLVTTGDGSPVFTRKSDIVPALNFTDKLLKVWIKVNGTDSVSELRVTVTSDDFRTYTDYWIAGDAGAQFNMGVMYANGLGVDRDMGVAMDWWEAAARQLHVRAAHNLALAMLAGEPRDGSRDGEPPDTTAILRYLKIGADAGYPNSEYTLGKLYAEGVGVEKDPRRAAELFLSASIKGFAKAQYNLGKIYRDGTGMKADTGLSLFWFAEAAERAVLDGQGQFL